MKREDAEQLLHHHYRLHTQIKSRIDNKIPKSMFVSPKSTHYRPFANRRGRSAESTPNPPRRPKGHEELAHFLARKQTPLTPSTLTPSFNAYARQSVANLFLTSSANSSRPSTSKDSSKQIETKEVKPKILETKTYYPAVRRSKPSSLGLDEIERSMTTISLNGRASSNDIIQKILRTKITSASGSSRFESTSRENRSLELTKNAQKYKEFKDAVLSDILRRGVFTDRVIKDSFYREIEKRTDLDLNQMEMIMFDTLTELGVQTTEASSIPAASRAFRPMTAKPRRVTIENGTTKSTNSKPSTVEFIEPDPPTIVDDDDSSQMSSMSSNSSKRSSSSKQSSEEESSKSEPPSESGSGSSDLTRISLTVLPPENLSPSSSDMEELARRRDLWKLKKGEQLYQREISLDRVDSV
ncbi:hypothetical protein FO519_004948 [Halicephalobus sp. NKZ332]|nr:hypothetical protein FO519_004948 [Halicephalobus sp. NKZ332]